LLERRIVLLRGDLDESLAGEVAASLMMLDATGDGAVDLQVDSAGGSLEAAFTVIDTIEALGVAVHATCVGRAEGSAVGVIAASGRRSAAPHGRFRLVEPTSTVGGTAGDIERWAEHRRGQFARFVDVLARATGRPQEHIEADISAGRWLSAAEAVEYRLVDRLWEPRSERRAPPPDGPRFGYGPH
jgi:ATP-dependent Clp protease protease subunit